MAESESTNANQVIDTNQPKPLKGLKLRGIKPVETINTVKKGAGPDGGDIHMVVNEEDYDKAIHGEKVDKLPTKKKAGKKKAGKKDDE